VIAHRATSARKRILGAKDRCHSADVSSLLRLPHRKPERGTSARQRRVERVLAFLVSNGPLPVVSRDAHENEGWVRAHAAAPCPEGAEAALSDPPEIGSAKRLSSKRLVGPLGAWPFSILDTLERSRPR
jgi:hypothetical protein